MKVDDLQDGIFLSNGGVFADCQITRGYKNLLGANPQSWIVREWQQIWGEYLCTYVDMTVGKWFTTWNEHKLSMVAQTYGLVVHRLLNGMCK